MSKKMTTNFYDKVAKKFGGYGYGSLHKHKSEYPNGEPEKTFRDKLLDLASKHKTALDIGCADGKFTLSVASCFKKVYGIDTSKVNLDIAVASSGTTSENNVEYSLQDASKTSFQDSFFNLAYCRRGPTYYKEYHRLLKTKGHYMEIGIGEKDALELKQIFKRGQGYGAWKQSKLEANIKKLTDLGFQILLAENYHYIEYYPSYQDLDMFLQSVPIFEDFDSQKDKPLLKKGLVNFS